jgi:hypothetical protein
LYALKVAAIIIVAVTEVSKTSTFLGALIKSFPVVSVVVLVWIYVESGDVTRNQCSVAKHVLAGYCRRCRCFSRCLRCCAPVSGSICRWLRRRVDCGVLRALAVVAEAPRRSVMSMEGRLFLFS